MNLLSDELLIEAYLAAVEYKLDYEFISLLFSEIRTRRIPL
ncbi:sporulation histidine kinase inhibitor Sda [Amphibacillus sp. Q70]